MSLQPQAPQESPLPRILQSRSVEAVVGEVYGEC